MLSQLRERVCEANLAVFRHGLAVLTWGNVSGIDREQGLVVIKASGVSYSDMTPGSMVVVDLDGRTVEGEFRPSSDTPTHLVLYRNFMNIGGITHTHSLHAAAFAQARREISCYGTTHADHFFGSVPVTRALTEAEVEGDYETETGNVIVERFCDIDPLAMPAVLVAGHGPFAWGSDPADSVKNAVALEQVAGMASVTRAVNPDAIPLEDYLLKKHYLRKHGPGAYYGQES